MSRNKIDANKSIFSALDSYCAERGDPISNSGQGRWIASQKDDREFLVYAKMVELLPLSPTMKAAFFSFRDRTYLVTAGFDTIESPDGLSPADPRGGHITAFLSETSLRPTATTAQVREVIEALDARDPTYEGHDHAFMQSLFLPLQIFVGESLPEEDAIKTLLMLCLADRRRFEHWIDEELARSLKNLVSVSAAAIPYRLLCSAALDFDPTAMFLALYRSLEALYAREQTTSFMSSTGISGDWVGVAEKLEEHLGWYPREEPSLEALLQRAKSAELELVLSALGNQLPEGVAVSRATSRRIYWLRNNLVHYRPLHRGFSQQGIDWCRLCEAMASIVVDAYAPNALGLSAVPGNAPEAKTEQQ